MINDDSIKRELSNWAEVSRRFKALPAETVSIDELSGASLAFTSIPSDDPTGLIELLETMKSEHINAGQRLLEKMPYFESIFCPCMPWKKGYPEAIKLERQILSRAAEYLKSFQKGEDYEIFPTAAGEVTAFHFCTEKGLQDFRIAVGLDPIGGFKEYLNTK